MHTQHFRSTSFQFFSCPLFFFLLIFFCSLILPFILFFFFFNDTATTEIYTLSLHDALPIFPRLAVLNTSSRCFKSSRWSPICKDRKSTRLNSSHLGISYAVFCLKKKKQAKRTYVRRAGQ